MDSPVSYISIRLSHYILFFVLWILNPDTNPHFSPAICCNAEYARVYCVSLGRPPQRTVRYASGVLPSHALYTQASQAFRGNTW